MSSKKENWKVITASYYTRKQVPGCEDMRSMWFAENLYSDDSDGNSDDSDGDSDDSDDGNSDDSNRNSDDSDGADVNDCHDGVTLRDFDSAEESREYAYCSHKP